jgi:hypothetical protein
MVLLPGEMPQDYWVMLHLSISIVDGERRASKTEVPWPNFITQGVSPRRGVGYLFPVRRHQWIDKPKQSLWSRSVMVFNTSVFRLTRFNFTYHHRSPVQNIWNTLKTSIAWHALTFKKTRHLSVPSEICRLCCWMRLPSNVRIITP